jgi:hypothetical protein
MDGNRNNSRSAADYDAPIFQAFSVKTTRTRARQKVDRAVSDILGPGWHAGSYGGRADFFEVFAGEGALTAREAWDRTYLLRAHAGISSAEPLFKAWVTDRPDWEVNVTAEPGDAVRGPQAALGFPGWSCGSGDDLTKAKGHEWSLELTNVLRAWSNHFPSSGPGPGDGVIIGHPDTGYRNHPEIAANLLVAKGYDLFRDDKDPLDELKKTFPWQNPGHGTGTASVIVSPEGPPHGVSGTAPYAKLIPFRVSDSVVVLDTVNLAGAIERATDQGAHVISISMGGLGSDRLHDAVVYATSRGVIVLAAAGNCVRFVVFPAAYDEVVAVAACDAERTPWEGSSNGRAVDITAPGDRVWRATANVDNAVAGVGQGSGTSYAVATVAGIAALWLAKHGRNTIIHACGGKERIAPTFLQLLRATATPMPDWPPGQFGGGLVDADALLSAPLPNGRTIPTLAPTASEHAAVGRGGVATFSHLFEGSVGTRPGHRSLNVDAALPGPSELEDRLAELLNTTVDKLPADLGQVGQELAFHLASAPELYRRFASTGPIRDLLLEKGVSKALEVKLSRDRPDK